MTHAHSSDSHRLKAPSSLDAYKRAMRRIDRGVSADGIAAGAQTYCDAVVTWLLRNAKRIRPGTWMIWRAAARHYFSQEGTREALEADDRLVASSPREGFKGVRPGTTQNLYASASTRRRHVMGAHLRALTRHLSAQARPPKGERVDRSSVVIAGLRATQAAGLRPSEWPRAAWDAVDPYLLRIRTAKRRQAAQTLPGVSGDGRPLDRAVRILAEDRLWVDLYMGYVAIGCSEEGGYDAFYEATDRKRYEACRELGFQLTFYMARGQFSADRKKLFGVAAAAKEMGNAPRKASSYYGPVGKARKGVKAAWEAVTTSDALTMSEEQAQSSASTVPDLAPQIVDNGFFDGPSVSE